MGEPFSTDERWVDAMRDTTRALARAQYAHVETVTGFYRRGVAADLARSGGWHRADEGAAATAVAAVMMRMSEYAVTGLVDVGLALDGLPCTRAAFGVGDLDLARVRAIVDVTTGCNEEARLELDRRLATLGATCAVPGLRSTGRRWAAKLDPASVAERRRRTAEDRDVRVRAARDGMAILDGWLPVEAAQILAHRLADMARDEVCAQDPRTFPQRRADALIALADGTGRLMCDCGLECPKSKAGPAVATPPAVIEVGVSLETLLGLREWPGYLSGAGAIDAELARTLAKDGRWEWIIAAIDAAATMTSPDTGTDPAAGVPTPGATAFDDPAASEQTVDVTDETDTAADDCADTYSSENTTESAGTAPNHRAVGGVPDPAPPPGPDPGSRNNSSPTGSRRRRTRLSAAARKAIAAACAARIGGWDDPDTEAALRYAWPENLARWIRARDLICRFPNCRVPARNCDIDHTIHYDHTNPHKGGRTIRTNAACLCRRHHRLKTDGENRRSGGWRVRQVDGRGRLAWTTPTGDVVFTDPEGAEFLWPVPDLIIPPPPTPPWPTPEDCEQLRARGEAIARRYGLELTDTTAIEGRYDETAEYYEFLAAAYPRRDGSVIDVDTSTPDDDEPPPF